MSAQRHLPIFFLLLGLILLGLGLFFSIPGTPMAAMDCGCGGAQNCVTKAASVQWGTVSLVSGMVFFAAGGVLSRFQRSLAI